MIRELCRRKYFGRSECVNTLLCNIFQSFMPVCFFVHIRDIRVGARQVNRVKILRFFHVKGSDLLRQSIVKRRRCIISQVGEITVDPAVDAAVLAVAVGAFKLSPFAVDLRLAAQIEIKNTIGDIQRSQLALSGPAPELARRIERALGQFIEGLDALILCHAERNDLLRRVDSLDPGLQHV